MPEIIFSNKIIPDMRFRIIYILVQISFLGVTALGRFSQCFFFYFRRRPTMIVDIFTHQPPYHKKLSTALVLRFTVILINSYNLALAGELLVALNLDGS